MSGIHPPSARLFVFSGRDKFISFTRLRERMLAIYPSLIPADIADIPGPLSDISRFIRVTYGKENLPSVYLSKPDKPRVSIIDDLGMSNFRTVIDTLESGFVVFATIDQWNQRKAFESLQWVLEYGLTSPEQNLRYGSSGIREWTSMRINPNQIEVDHDGKDCSSDFRAFATDIKDDWFSKLYYG